MFFKAKEKYDAWFKRGSHGTIMNKPRYSSTANVVAFNGSVGFNRGLGNPR